MKKIKWGNVLKTVLFILCSGVVLYDIYNLTIYSFITSKITTLTWTGVITNMLCMFYIVYFVKDFTLNNK